MMILWIALALLAVVAVAAALYFFCSPMPIVRLLRKGGDAPAGWPEGEEHTPEQVEILRDLPYESPYGRNQYDLYLPKNATGLLPVVVWIHGGAFVAGNKSGVENWATCLAAKGMAVAAVEYQWAPEAHWPAQVLQIGQCCQALERQVGLDMSRVVIAGDSAGAHMAAQFALIHTSPAFREQTGLKPVLASDALKAALLYCGPYDIGQMARPQNRFLRLAMHRVGWSYLGLRHWQGSAQAKATVIKNYVTEAFPPTYLSDGNRGSFEKQGRALEAALKAVGASVTGLFFSPEEGEIDHEYQFQMHTSAGRRCYEGTLRFLAELGLTDKSGR